MDGISVLEADKKKMEPWQSMDDAGIFIIITLLLGVDGESKCF